LKTAFVARPTEYGPLQVRDFKAEGDWDVVAKDFNEIAIGWLLRQDLREGAVTGARYRAVFAQFCNNEPARPAITGTRREPP